MNIRSCRSCGAEIVWVETENKKRMPIDAEPTDAGKFVLEDEGTDTPRALYRPGANGERFTSHFATCPNAAEHRRPAPVPAPKVSKPTPQPLEEYGPIPDDPGPRAPIVCPVCMREAADVAVCKHDGHDMLCIAYVHGGDAALELCHSAPKGGA